MIGNDGLCAIDLGPIEIDFAVTSYPPLLQANVQHGGAIGERSAAL